MKEGKKEGGGRKRGWERKKEIAGEGETGR